MHGHPAWGEEMGRQRRHHRPFDGEDPACAVAGAGGADTEDPADAVAWVEQVAATSAQPSCSC